jgi:hypothetical protein
MFCFSSLIARFPSSFFAIGKIDTCRQWSIQFLIIIIYLLFAELSSRNHCQHMCFSRKLKHMWTKTLLLHLDLASLSKRGTHTHARARFFLLSFVFYSSWDFSDGDKGLSNLSSDTMSSIYRYMYTLKNGKTNL